MAFNFIKLAIDAMQASYQKKCERNRESANRRWNKTEDANECERIQTDTNECEAMQSNQINSNQINSNQINSNQECVSENAPTHTLTHEEEIFNQFNEYCRVVAPLAIAFKEPLSLKDFEWLYKTYGPARIKKCAEELHNKEAYKKNRRAITAWKAFIGKIS
jgi:hypothetical protein